MLEGRPKSAFLVFWPKKSLKVWGGDFLQKFYGIEFLVFWRNHDPLFHGWDLGSIGQPGLVDWDYFLVIWPYG